MQDWTRKLEYEDYAWTGLDKSLIQDIHKSTYNPLLGRRDLELDSPGLRELYLMNDSDYIYFAARALLNIELWPLQAVALSSMWNHAFPMLICSRGFSKTFSLAVYSMLRAILNPGIKIVVSGAVFRQSRFVFNNILTIWNNSPVLQSIYRESSDGPKNELDMLTFKFGQSMIYCIPVGDGCLTPDTAITYDDHFGYMQELFSETPKSKKEKRHNKNLLVESDFRNSDTAFYNGYKDVLKLKTKKGYEIKATPNHKIMVWDSDKLDTQWKELQDVTADDYICINNNKKWHNGKELVEDKDAYALGLMTGDGSWVNDYKLQYTTCDEELIKPIKESISDKFKSADGVHYHAHGKQLKESWCDKWELDYKAYAIDKHIPRKVMAAPQETMSAFLSGLFDSDGHVTFDEGRGKSIKIGLSTTSQRLAKEVHYVLGHYGINALLRSRDRDKNWNTSHEILISGPDVKLFQEHINFRLGRKKKLLEDAISSKSLFRKNSAIVPDVKNALIHIYNKYNKNVAVKIPSTVKNRKTFTIDFISKFLKQYPLQDDEIYQKLQAVLDRNIYFDKVSSVEDAGKEHTYDLHVPELNYYTANNILVHNSKIRGLRGNVILMDEFDSCNTEIYETVISNFAAVSMNPVVSLQKEAKKAALLAAGKALPEELELDDFRNQSIISGTMGYEDKPMCQYWKRYKDILDSKGEVLSSETETFSDLNWKDFCIIRIPYELIPRGFMDDKTVSRARAVMHTGTYNSEYGCVPVKDSAGFFKRSLIEACTCKDSDVQDESFPKWCQVPFDPAMHGSSKYKYVMGVDPASEADNFAVVILEVHPEHQRVVYVWTTNRKTFKGKSNNYYAFCANKIRELKRLFNIEYIGIDAQGGGHAIEEALHDEQHIPKGEVPFWPVVEDKWKESDDQPGEHILHMIQFANAKWTADANHGLRKDLESKTLLFPRFNTILLGLAGNESGYNGESLEDNMMEIEELKNELCMIVYEKTQNRERWDTPKVKVGNRSVASMRKDRYSALTIANSLARSIGRPMNVNEVELVGGRVGVKQKRFGSEGLYVNAAGVALDIPEEVFRRI